MNLTILSPKVNVFESKFGDYIFKKKSVVTPLSHI